MNERCAAAKANRVRKPSGCSAERTGWERKRVDRCVQSDIRAFGVAGGWKATAVKAKVWVDTVTEGGQRCMAVWRKEEGDAARHRQEKREATRLGKLLPHTEA